MMIACDLIAAFLALLWLKPVAKRTIAQAEATLGEPAPRAARCEEWRKRLYRGVASRQALRVTFGIAMP